MKIAIIGAVAAGTSAAMEIRRKNKKAEITVYEKDRYISYSSCGMPYFLGNDFSSFEDLVPRDAEFFKQKHNINIYILHEVQSIDSSSNTLKVKNLLTGQEFQDVYDKLIIATGAVPEKPSIDGSNRENVFVLRNINDMKNIKMYINLNKCRKAAIIGSGPIGLEMVEALTKMDLKTTLIARSTVGKGLMPEMNARLEKHLIDQGVDVVSNAAIDKIEEKGVLLTNGKLYGADIVLLAAGVKPAVELAKSAGIKLGTTGAIAVDQYMKTSNPDIYACGDCAEYFNRITMAPIYRPLGSTANKTGIIAGNHIVGGTDKFEGILGTNIFKVFDLTVAQTGLTQKEAILAGYDAVAVLDKRPNKPKFMGGEDMLINAVADRKSRRLLGCQIIGTKGVDRRIDVVAAILTLKGGVEDLISLDLAYAPPYSTPKDPLFFTGIKLREEMEK